MTLSITFDYSLDSNGFFDSRASRNALEAAAAVWTRYIDDDFDPIPVGAQFSVRNPSVGGRTDIVTTTAIDDLRIYVGAATTPFNEGSTSAARAGPTGFDLDGSVFSARISSDFQGRGPAKDFEPWAGAISFDSDLAWDFGTGPGTPSGQLDFVAIAAHEIGHILGIGASRSFTALIEDGHLVGANVQSLVPGGAPVDGGHFLRDGDDHDHDHGELDTVLFAQTANGARPGALDFATLADLGYEIDFPGETFTRTVTKFEIASEGSETIEGTTFADTIMGLGGDDNIRGGEGDDLLVGGAGNDVLFGQEGADTVAGNSGNDNIFGREGDDDLRGGGGDDTLQGGIGFDTLNGGTGDDLLSDDAGGAVHLFEPKNGVSFGTDQVVNFDPGTDFLRFDSSLGFLTPQEAFDGITRMARTNQGSFFNEIETPLGTVQVFATAPLTVDDFQIAGATVVSGGAGADRLRGTVADEVFDGLAGRDTVVFSGPRSATEVTVSEGNILASGPGGNDVLRSIERLEFSDGALVFDIPDALPVTFDDGDVLDNYVYPLYAASFNRAPDEAGLRFWTGVANDPTIRNVPFDATANQTAQVNAQVRLAVEFVSSDEFNTPDATTADGFVRKLYTNFLDRAPDPEGFTFWRGVYQQRLDDELAGDRLPEGLTFFDPGAGRNLPITTEQWAKAVMLRDFASHPDIFDRIEDDVTTGLYVLGGDIL